VHLDPAVSSPSYLVLLMKTRFDLNHFRNGGKPNQELGQLCGCEVESAHVHVQIVGSCETASVSYTSQTAVGVAEASELTPIGSAERRMPGARSGLRP
jgi:hypothetical protein